MSERRHPLASDVADDGGEHELELTDAPDVAGDGGLDVLDALLVAANVLAETGRPVLLDLSGGFRMFAENPAISLEAAIGLGGSWRKKWRAKEAERRRDAAYRALARRVTGKSDRARAEAIEAMLKRYVRRWRSDRDAGRRPQGFAGLMYDVLDASDGKVLSAERIRKIL
jgi:hypothetical protein